MNYSSTKRGFEGKTCNRDRAIPIELARALSAQHPDSGAAVAIPSESSTVKTGARVGVLKSISAFETNQSPAKRKAYPPKLGVGFLLVDSSLSSISFNAEAIHILGYPDKVENLARSESLLSEEIRSRLRLERSLDDSAFITEFQSGRRRYFCRAFQIGSHKARFCSIQHSASA